MASPTTTSSDIPASSVRQWALGGLLMGIANLIPGVSGGTMILAMGLYTEFIDSVAAVTSFRFNRRHVLFLGVVGGCAAVGIVALAGVILYLLFHHAAAMYALFIGLTLGGAPLLTRSLRPVRADVVIATALGLGVMVGVFMLRTGAGMPHNAGMDLVSGVVGSTTMVLPGISGSYMLLVMDQYDRVVGTVTDLKAAAATRDPQLLKRALWIAVPVGLGVVAGIVALSNVLKFLLHRHQRVTIGFLLGMLLGSVIGLWPFGRVPSADAMERRSTAELKAYAVRFEIPIATDMDKEAIMASIREGGRRGALRERSAGTIGVVALMVVCGFLVTRALASRGQTLGAAGVERPPGSAVPVKPSSDRLADSPERG